MPLETKRSLLALAGATLAGQALAGCGDELTVEQAEQIHAIAYEMLDQAFQAINARGYEYGELGPEEGTPLAIDQPCTTSGTVELALLWYRDGYEARFRTCAAEGWTLDGEWSEHEDRTVAELEVSNGTISAD